ncbi:MAG: hypothetical protein ACK4UT_00075 [Moraxellaceae bacterium]
MSTQTVLERLAIDLGPDFDRRWRAAPRPLRRELIAEIRALYRFLDEDDVPLASEPASLPPEAPAATVATPAPRQNSLFEAPATPARPAAKENPFLPRSVLDRLQQSQQQARGQLQGLMPAPGARPPAASHEQVDLERELRLKLGPVIETLIDAHMEQLRSELRVRLRAEMDRLIAEHVRKG